MIMSCSQMLEDERSEKEQLRRQLEQRDARIAQLEKEVTLLHQVACPKYSTSGLDMLMKDVFQMYLLPLIGRYLSSVRLRSSNNPTIFMATHHLC